MHLYSIFRESPGFEPLSAVFGYRSALPRLLVTARILANDTRLYTLSDVQISRVVLLPGARACSLGNGVFRTGRAAAVKLCGRTWSLSAFLSRQPDWYISDCVRADGRLLQSVSVPKRSLELCCTAVLQCADSLVYCIPMSAALCMLAVCESGRTLRHVPLEEKSTELCLAAVTQDGHALPFVPEPVPYNVALAAVKQNYSAIAHVRADWLYSAELCRVAIEICPRAMQFIPIELRDDVLTLYAVSREGALLEHVPKQMLEGPDGIALCNAAVASDGTALRFVPAECAMDASFCAKCLMQNGLALQYVSPTLLHGPAGPYLARVAVLNQGLALQYIRELIVKDDRTVEMTDNISSSSGSSESSESSESSVSSKSSESSESCCVSFSSNLVKIAVANNGRALQFVPSELVSIDLCQIAVQNCGMALEFVPPQFRTSDVLRTALNNDGMSLQFCASECTLQQCMSALFQNGLALQFASSHDAKNLHVCRAAVHSNPLALQFARVQDVSLCAIAVTRRACCTVLGPFSKQQSSTTSSSPRALQYVWNQTDDIVRLAIRHNALSLEHVRDPTPDIVRLALKRNGMALQFVTHQTPEFCRIAVWQTGMALQFVKDQTTDIVQLAVKQNPDALRFCNITAETVWCALFCSTYRSDSELAERVHAALSSRKTVLETETKQIES